MPQALGRRSTCSHVLIRTPISVFPLLPPRLPPSPPPSFSPPPPPHTLSFPPSVPPPPSSCPPQVDRLQARCSRLQALLDTANSAEAALGAQLADKEDWRVAAALGLPDSASPADAVRQCTLLREQVLAPFPAADATGCALPFTGSASGGAAYSAPVHPTRRAGEQVAGPPGLPLAGPACHPFWPGGAIMPMILDPPSPPVVPGRPVRSARGCAEGPSVGGRGALTVGCTCRGSLGGRVPCSGRPAAGRRRISPCVLCARICSGAVCPGFQVAAVCLGAQAPTVCGCSSWRRRAGQECGWSASGLPFTDNAEIKTLKKESWGGCRPQAAGLDPTASGWTKTPWRP